MKINKIEAILITAISIVGIVVIYNIIIYIPTNNYSLNVDAIKDPESLFVNSRIILKNTGKLALNNIQAVYDNNTKYIDKLVKLNPGETIILSPPVGASLKIIHVTSKEGIDIIKGYRSPTKLPGMMGS